MKLRIGFTLVEVMVAAAIFGFSLLGVLGMAGYMHKTSISNVANDVALQIADGMMEQVRSMPYDSVLAPSAADKSGLKTLSFVHYEPPTVSGDLGRQVSQEVPVNSASYTRLDGVAIASRLSPSFKISESYPMDVEVKVHMNPVADSNFANGVSVELFYRFRANPSTDYRVRVVKTFIPRFYQ